MGKNEPMMDIGWGEIAVLLVIALFIFGPEKLPKAAADAGRLVRRLREMATNAQAEVSSHGIDVEGIKKDLRGVADLHPKKLIGSITSDITGTPTASKPTTTSPTIASASNPAAVVEPPAAIPGSPRLDPDAT